MHDVVHDDDSNRASVLVFDKCVKLMCVLRRGASSFGQYNGVCLKFYFSFFQKMKIYFQNS